MENSEEENSLDITKFFKFNKESMNAVLIFFIILYSSLINVQLPKIIKDAFENPFFKVFFLTIIVYRAQNSQELALVVALCYILIMNFINTSPETFVDSTPEQSLKEETEEIIDKSENNVKYDSGNYICSRTPTEEEVNPYEDSNFDNKKKVKYDRNAKNIYSNNTSEDNSQNTTQESVESDEDDDEIM